MTAPPVHTLRVYGAAIIACIALALVGQSCGFMSSSDCGERATCPGDATGPGSDGTPAGGDDGSDDMTAQTGDDGDGTTPESDEANADVAAEGDVSVDAPDVGVDVTIKDVTSEDVTGDRDASFDVVSEDVGADVLDARPDTSDACIDSGTEDCTNGIDDNCDGKIDCADPICQAASYTCVPPPPSGTLGWTGPVAMATVSNPMTPPACPTSYAPALTGDPMSGFNAPAAICGSCSCTGSGQVCSLNALIYKDTSCSSGSACGSAVAAPSGQCVALPSCGIGTSFSINLPVPTISGGSCVGGTGTTTLPPVTWTTTARVCSYQGPPDMGGCTNSNQCLRAPSGSFGARLCVYTTTVPPPTSCPAPYNGMSPSTFYQGATEGRSCSACSCTTTTPTGGSCSGSVAVSSACGAASVNYTLGTTTGTPPGCSGGLTLAQSPAFIQGTYAVTPGSCSVQTNATSMGAAMPSGPVTVCCM
jgi:hypothetical protein